jgi:hypothetical protein
MSDDYEGFEEFEEQPEFRGRRPSMIFRPDFEAKRRLSMEALNEEFKGKTPQEIERLIAQKRRESLKLRKQYHTSLKKMKSLETGPLTPAEVELELKRRKLSRTGNELLQERNKRLVGAERAEKIIKDIQK